MDWEWTAAGVHLPIIWEWVGLYNSTGDPMDILWDPLCPGGHWDEKDRKTVVELVWRSPVYWDNEPRVGAVSKRTL